MVSFCRQTFSSTTISSTWSSFWRTTPPSPSACGCAGAEASSFCSFLSPAWAQEDCNKELLWCGCLRVFLWCFHSGQSGSEQPHGVWWRSAEGQGRLQEEVRCSESAVWRLDGRLWATLFFCCRFFDKTKNEWEQRGSFEKVAGKYDMVFMDYSTNEKVGWSKNSLQSRMHESVRDLFFFSGGEHDDGRRCSQKEELQAESKGSVSPGAHLWSQSHGGVRARDEVRHPEGSSWSVGAQIVEFCLF